MKKLLAAVLLVSVWCCYDWLRPVEAVSSNYVVKPGDSWYQICDAHYITKNNSESFNEFWYRAMAENEHYKNLQPGNVLTITNRVYK